MSLAKNSHHRKIGLSSVEVLTIPCHCLSATLFLKSDFSLDMFRQEKGK